jgi:hypothetical protein
VEVVVVVVAAAAAAPAGGGAAGAGAAAAPTAAPAAAPALDVQRSNDYCYTLHGERATKNRPYATIFNGRKQKMLKIISTTANEQRFLMVENGERATIFNGRKRRTGNDF